jgi:hypothetical protein
VVVALPRAGAVGRRRPRPAVPSVGWQVAVGIAPGGVERAALRPVARPGRPRAAAAGGGGAVADRQDLAGRKDRRGRPGAVGACGPAVNGRAAV